MQEILLLRSFHDMECGDVPVLFTNWSTDLMEVALEYWMELSKGSWSREKNLLHCAYYPCIQYDG